MANDFYLSLVSKFPIFCPGIFYTCVVYNAIIYMENNFMKLVCFILEKNKWFISGFTLKSYQVLFFHLIYIWLANQLLFMRCCLVLVEIFASQVLAQTPLYNISEVDIIKPFKAASHRLQICARTHTPTLLLYLLLSHAQTFLLW